MQAALKQDLTGVDEYLAGEQAGEVRHEYIDGAVYAMAGASREHNEIIGNIYSSLRTALRGTGCRAFFLDLKVRLNLQEQNIFYYPDLMVGCDPRDTERLYLRYPRILMEVSSESTERLDRHEKLSAYQTIESLEEYLIVAQVRMEVILFRRMNKWLPEVYNVRDQTVRLASINFALPLTTIYEGVLPEAIQPPPSTKSSW
jgi:Uma2 family endonuclease